jgi:hypothetical protein
MKLTPEQIESMLEAAKPSVIESLQKELTNSISWQVKEGAQTQIAAYVKKWVDENVLPEVEKTLIENKESLIGVGVKMAEVMTDELAKSFTEAVKETLSTSYRRSEVFKALLR